MSKNYKKVNIELDQEARLSIFDVTQGSGSNPLMRVSSTLVLPENQRESSRWQGNFRGLVRQDLNNPPRIGDIPGQITNYSEEIQRNACQEARVEFASQSRQWLEDNLRTLKEEILDKTSDREEVIINISTDDRKFIEFPWSEWSLWEKRPQAWFALSPTSYKSPSSAKSREGKIRLLAILGGDKGIDVQKDKVFLNQLPNTDPEFLVKEPKSRFSDALWEQTWDILSFSGHSSSQGDRGSIAINDHENLNLDELRDGLKKAISRGLKLAIFNSCDGLKLAEYLQDLNIPQVIVMREPVPNGVAQDFFKYFLDAFFYQRESFYYAVRTATERINEDYNNSYPGIGWLPVVFQNPATEPLIFQKYEFFDHPQYQYLKSNIAQFVGRQFVFDSFQKFIENNSNGYFTIVGNPGEGKTTIVSKYILSNQSQCVYYFNRLNTGQNKIESFIRLIYEQLNCRFRLSKSLPTVPPQDSSFLQEILGSVSKQLPPNEKLIVVIDALDEINLDEQSKHQKEKTNFLYLPEVLPDNIYVLLTRRRQESLSQRLRFQCHQEIFDLKDYPENCREDMKDYIILFLNDDDYQESLKQWYEKQDLTREEFIELLCDKSENNFLYLRCVIPEIAKGFYSDFELKDLPQGLTEFYAQQWERMFSHLGQDGLSDGQRIKQTLQLRIIDYLSQSSNPITTRKICDYLKRSLQNADQIDILIILKEWGQFLEEQKIDGDTYYSIYHTSFRNFLDNHDFVKATRSDLNSSVEDANDDMAYVKQEILNTHRKKIKDKRVLSIQENMSDNHDDLENKSDTVQNQLNLSIVDTGSSSSFPNESILNNTIFKYVILFCIALILVLLIFFIFHR
ncbi:hypothetical protein PN502_15365 [Microcystis aeruginosa CS-338/01]|uniref:CHAT domain-containing protein n=1 Tax=Microcystis aeruginosa TaxID=1126 RepID=UPI00232BC6AF|nr:CHAT domain-containing protein [Microcystis aeruginosa]MDB9508419.1 hypothetical protein [Microcystis aeruginosa CS-338/01]